MFPKKKEDNKKEVKTKKFFLKKMKKLGKVADPRKYETKKIGSKEFRFQNISESPKFWSMNFLLTQNIFEPKKFGSKSLG